MATIHTLLTDAAYAEPTAFWLSALGAMDDDYHFRQPWLSMPAAEGRRFREPCLLTPETIALVEDLSRGQDLGVLVVVSGAVAMLLHTYTHADVVAIDTPPLAGTGAEDVTREAVPLIIPVDGRLSVRDYLRALGERVANSYSYQLPCSMAQLSETLRGKPQPRTNVLVTMSGLHDDVARAAAYDLRIDVARGADVGLSIEGCGPAFSAEYLRTFSRHLGRVLEGFRDLSCRLEDIDIMGADERHRLLVHYNATGGHAAPGRTIHALFEEQVERAGQQTAVRLGDTAISYDALNRTANQLARVLQTDYGIQPGDVVGIVTHRSPQTIAGLLAVLKAGGVYLPIDPDYPETRLQFMVADASVKALLIHSEQIERLALLYETPMFALDLQLQSLETSDANLAPATIAADPAYIIYTSGSTGQPKAVLLEHSGLVNMVKHHVHAFGIEPSDRLLQFYAHSFDSSLFEIFVALLSGATLVLVDRDTINDPQRLSAYIEAQGITTLTLPPVYLGTLDFTQLAAVRRYISAGDHCRVETARFFARAGAYYNSYGPTETSVCVTHFRVDPDAHYGSRVPIGKPIAGTSIYLLDEQLKPVLDGMVGEICVAGAGLARGYLNREELTAARFVRSPFVDAERLYLTGDLGAWLPDGNLEVIGRKDHQVKIRGFRVEPGEIEAVLDQHPDIRESVVIAREDDTGHKRLVAYVTGSSTGAIEIGQLKTLLRSRLPEFMVPSAFVVLERMPLSANGKIDRQALPSHIGPTPASVESTGRPQNPTQETLARIWREVLGLERVGIDDNLFDLGGDSIVIIQIVSRAREANLKLIPNQLFAHQTIARLAEVAVVITPAGQVAHEQGPLVGPTPLTPMQAWFFEQAFADPHHFNQSVMLDVPDDLDAATIAAATAAVVAHHDALRLRFAVRDSRWSAEYAVPSNDAPFDTIDLSLVAVEDRDTALRAAVQDSQASFNLSTGPLLRVRLMRLGGGRPSRLLVVAHHLVIDGVSWRILLGDLHTACSQRRRAEAVVLPAKTTSYHAWSEQLTALAAGGCAGDAAYWLAAEQEMLCPLPVDHHPRTGANTVATAREVSGALDADATLALLQDVPRAYTTDINDVLLAALAITLRPWTGNDLLWIDLEGHGRDELLDDFDTSRTVGWFTAQCAVQLKVVPDAAPGVVIKSVKEQLRAVPHRGSRFGVLRYLSPDEHLVSSLRALPPPEILFNYFGQAGRILSPELQWTMVQGPAGLDVSPAAQRSHLLEINAIVADGRLALTWTFSEAIHRRDTIEELARRYEHTLRLLIDHCRTLEDPQHTPSDFPAARLDQRSLDALIAKLGR
jgi:amino acid adenylation domain-containing protein/non-ribosomal peptide synthase protein (TIGR01720 family)